MPSRPLSDDTSALAKLHTTRLDVEAMDLAKGRTEMAAAVALVPPARLDLVNEVLEGAGRLDLSVSSTGRQSTWSTSSPIE